MSEVAIIGIGMHPFGRHDGVDFPTGHDAVRNVQTRIDSFVRRMDKVLEHDFIEGYWIEIDSRTIGVDLIAHRANTVKHFVR
mgnify:CR=1 FL=1